MFRKHYYKTKYFTFRERFNLVALILKVDYQTLQTSRFSLTSAQHSKTTCNDLLKGQRLYDVIGNSYHLETRVTSNKRANAERAIRLAKVKTQEEEEKTNSRNKRPRGADAGEESGENNATSRKQQEVDDAVHGSADDFNSADAAVSTDVSSANPAGSPTDASAGSAAVKKAPRKSKKTSAAPLSNSNVASDGKVAKSCGRKRILPDTDDEEEPPAPPAKKSRTDSFPKAVKKNKAAMPVPAGDAADDGNESAYEEKPSTRRKAVNKSTPASKTKRKSLRLKEPAAGPSNVSTSTAASCEESVSPK